MSEAKKVLVVYYSFSGNTKTVGQAIASKLGADVEEIVEARPRKGLVHTLVAGYQIGTGALAQIQPIRHDPALYDLVIVGSPVYGGQGASPVRAYLMQQKLRIKRVAYFMTGGDPHNEQSLAKMGRTLGKAPVAALCVAAADVATGAYQEKMRVFCAELARSSLSL